MELKSKIEMLITSGLYNGFSVEEIRPLYYHNIDEIFTQKEIFDYGLV